MGSDNPWVRYLFKTYESEKEMIEAIPYFAGFVTLVFGLGFYFGLQEIKEFQEDTQKVNKEVLKEKEENLN